MNHVQDHAHKREQLEQALAVCMEKTSRNIKKIGTDLREFPEAADGHYFRNREQSRPLQHIMSWIPSFFTGMAYWSQRVSGDADYLKWMNALYPLYERKVFDHRGDTMHDLGFLYSPYSVALCKLTGDVNQQKLALKAADELVKRFDLNGGYIRAWGRMDDQIPPDVTGKDANDCFYLESKGIAIIDCMMNLPLLFWASEETGNPFYRNIAIRHARTTGKHFIRTDKSVYQAFRFDPETGKPERGCNFGGFNDESYWARGTAWAIYGFAIAFSYTRIQEFLDTATELAHAFIAQLDDSLIPVWDFRLPPGQEKLKDSSAAAIAVCGFQEIMKHSPSDSLLLGWSNNILLKLSEPSYLDSNADVPGVLKESNGRSSYTSYGDYYYMEALVRNVHGFDTFW